MLRSDVLTTARFAGSVTRYHTWLLLRPQSVGEHSWQIARIYYEIFGPLPPEVSTYIIWHDAGELVLGDLPFPVKANNPELKKACDEIEHMAVTGLGGELPDLSADEKARVKICDLLDMEELGRQEKRMGNQFAQPIIDDIGRALDNMLPTIEPSWQSAIERYRRRMTRILG